MPTTLCWVKWRDASYERGEYTREELTPCVTMESAGVVAREDDEQLSLALDYSPAFGRFESSYRHIVHIPKCNIIKERRFEIKRT